MFFVVSMTLFCSGCLILSITADPSYGVTILALHLYLHIHCSIKPIEIDLLFVGDKLSSPNKRITNFSKISTRKEDVLSFPSQILGGTKLQWANIFSLASLQPNHLKTFLLQLYKDKWGIDSSSSCVCLPDTTASGWNMFHLSSEMVKIWMRTIYFLY